MTDTTNNAEDISAAPTVRGYYEAPPFPLLWKPSFPHSETRGCQLSGGAQIKLEIVPRQRLPEISLENQPKYRHESQEATRRDLSPRGGGEDGDIPPG